MKKAVAGVVIIVSVLVVVYLSVLPNNSHPKRHDLVWQNKMKQVFLACMVYAEEHDCWPQQLTDLPSKEVSEELLWMTTPNTDWREKWLYFRPEEKSVSANTIVLATPVAWRRDYSQPKGDGTDLRIVVLGDGSAKVMTEKEYEADGPQPQKKEK